MVCTVYAGRTVSRPLIKKTGMERVYRAWNFDSPYPTIAPQPRQSPSPGISKWPSRFVRLNLNILPNYHDLASRADQFKWEGERHSWGRRGRRKYHVMDGLNGVIIPSMPTRDNNFFEGTPPQAFRRHVLPEAYEINPTSPKSQNTKGRPFV